MGAVALKVTFDAGGTPLEVGSQIAVYVPLCMVGDIAKVSMIADQSGSVVVDVWKDVIANHPPTDADSITAAAPPTISSDVQSQDATLTGWTVALAEGDVLIFNVDSCTAITKLEITVEIATA